MRAIYRLRSEGRSQERREDFLPGEARLTRARADLPRACSPTSELDSQPHHRWCFAEVPACPSSVPKLPHLGLRRTMPLFLKRQEKHRVISRETLCSRIKLVPLSLNPTQTGTAAVPTHTFLAVAHWLTATARSPPFTNRWHLTLASTSARRLREKTAPTLHNSSSRCEMSAHQCLFEPLS